MPKTRTVFVSIAAVAAAAAIASIAAVAQQALSGAQKLMTVQASRLPGKVHVLPATLETTQWGWFDNAELPRLSVDPATRSSLKPCRIRTGNCGRAARSRSSRNCAPIGPDAGR